jgi:ferrous iron transport protein B
MATVFNLGSGDDDIVSLRQTLRDAVDPDTGLHAYSPLIGVSLMVFFVLACQCMSTVAVVKRETNSWRWAFVHGGDDERARVASRRSRVPGRPP